jgi:chromosomal replication initiator protein
MAPFEITVPRNVPEPVLPPIIDEQIREAHAILQSKGLLNQIDIIQRAVLAKFPGVLLSDLKSNRRTAKVVLPRQIGMYLCREMTNKSLPDIGRRFGGRDHTTVIHAINKITGMIRDNEVFANFVNGIRELV